MKKAEEEISKELDGGAELISALEDKQKLLADSSAESTEVTEAVMA